jgi:hypothetical protein
MAGFKHKSGQSGKACHRFSEADEKMEARGGIEPPIKVLQTFALPLGDRAACSWQNQIIASEA